MSIGRVFRWLAAAALIAVGVFWPLVLARQPGAAPDTDLVRFSDYAADFVVDSDGNLNAVEKITAEFPGDRHGIFRYWNVDNAFAPGARQEPTNISVLLDGKPVQTEVYWENPQLKTARIGDPHAFLTHGAHVFEIRYSIAGVLDPGTTGDELDLQID